MKKHVLILLLLLCVSLVPAFSASYYYEQGDTAFSFNVGVDFPAFFAFTNNSEKKTELWTSGTHAKLGGYGSLGYQVFLTREIALGGEIGYAFNNSFASNKLLTTVPITVKASWYPVQTGKFDLIVHANAGITFLNYDGCRFVAPHAKISINPAYYFTDSLGVGIDAGLWMNYEFYNKSATGYKSNENAFAGFIPLTVSLIYRH